MNDKSVTKRNDKGSKVIKSNKRLGVVESHDPSHTVEIHHKFVALHSEFVMNIQ